MMHKSVVIFISAIMIDMSLWLYRNTHPDPDTFNTDMGAIMFGWAAVFVLAAAVAHIREVVHERREE